MTSTYVMGISMSSHDRAAALLKDGEIIGAIAEERLDRRKKSQGFYSNPARDIVLPPCSAITQLLREHDLSYDDIDLVICGSSIRLCKSLLLAYIPFSPECVHEIPVPGHHLAHAYSAYATSAFTDPAVLVIDEQGHHLPDDRYEKVSWYQVVDGRLKNVTTFYGDATNISLGLFYDIFAGMLGLSEAGLPAAGKLMGLAPFGRTHPEWPPLMRVEQSGDVKISLSTIDQFLHDIGCKMHPGMSNLFVTKADEILAKYISVDWSTELGADLAYKAQEELESAVLAIATVLKTLSGSRRLCYAGGVALNCTTNARLSEAGWDDVYVHPAATDDGIAIGLAYYGWIELLNHKVPERRFSPFTGRQYASAEVTSALERFGLAEIADRVDDSRVAADVAAGSIVCWFHGRSEWGPRALGARSIVASPLIPFVPSILNRSVKFREAFRPFGLSITAEAAEALLELGTVPRSLGPYMLSIAKVKDSRLRALAHVDGTVRYQIVEQARQDRWHSLIDSFGSLTGVPALVNTSFNSYGEPLVETPSDALRQFLLSSADALVLEDRLLRRASVPHDLLSHAQQMALRESTISPLNAARAIAAAGYIKEAICLLSIAEYDEERAKGEGIGAYLEYKMLQLAYSVERADSAAAIQDALAILRISGLPLTARNALTYLARVSEEQTDTWKAAMMLNHLSAPGKMWAFVLNSVYQ